MLILSNNTISLTKSADYKKIVVVTYISAMFVLYRSSLPLTLECIVEFGLFIHLLYIFFSKKFLHEETSLVCQSNFWVLRKGARHPVKFETVKLKFDGDFFMILQLSGFGLRRKMVVFCDQLSSEQQRYFRIQR